MDAGGSKRLRDPLVWTHGLQLVKTTVAVVVAWTLAVRVFDVSQTFLAPWAALLTVHATVFGTLKRGAEQVGAAVLGVLLAFAAGSVFGLGAVSLGLAVLFGLLAGSVRGQRSEATTAAATALVVLTTGYSDDGSMLVDRLFDTGIGVAVGLLVNLLVWPPLRDRAAAHRIDAIDDGIGALLQRIAADLRNGVTSADVDAWVERVDGLDGDVSHAWSVLGQAHESGRLNPRLSARSRMRATDTFDGVLERLEQAVAETRSMVRSIRLAAVAPAAWPTGFRDAWVALADGGGAAICAADREALQRASADLDACAADLEVANLPSGFWPVAGALLMNLRNIFAALDPVAGAQPLTVPPPRLISRA